MQYMTLSAPAKLNLFLHINSQRVDGYHELETVFTFLNYGDELTFTTTEDTAISICGDTNDIALENNLIYKAASSLMPYNPKRLGINVKLIKKLPMGGGIGGGSSDAASTLLAVNQLWQCGLSLEKLAEIGLTLGADVPVFIRGYSALAQGVGEHLQPIATDNKWYLVVYPNTHVSTAQIFGHSDLPRCTAKLTNGWNIGNTRNDCEGLVKKLYPEVEKTLQWLLKYGSSRMTGTGACCFVDFISRKSAENALNVLPSCWQGFIAQSSNISLAHTQLEIWLKNQK
jgi:4-diphosphocytidyl-2-C-methyl-D-erythritol kinase